jgi:hypothetical protein
MEDAVDHECICSVDGLSDECICKVSDFEYVICPESDTTEPCVCESKGGCSCQGCGCEENVLVTQCGCGNWQQCVIETQDNEGEH